MNAFSPNYTPRIKVEKTTERRQKAMAARERNMNSDDPDKAWAARGVVPGLGMGSDLKKVGRVLKPSQLG